LLTNNPDLEFDVVVVCREDFGPLGDRLLTSLRSFRNISLRFIMFQPPADLYLPVRVHYSIDSYSRLWVADFFPESVDRVLYLDCDLIVLGSIEPLYRSDLQGHLLGAVAIPGSTRCEFLGIPEAFGYFNSGVLVIDLRQWRQTDAIGELIRYVMANPEKLIDADQDALNACFFTRRQSLSYIWNVISPFYFDYHPLGIDAEEVAAIRRDARIVHFNGASKPWSYMSRHPHRGDYLRYLKMSEWRDYVPPDRTVSNMLKRHITDVMPNGVKRVIESQRGGAKPSADPASCPTPATVEAAMPGLPEGLTATMEAENATVARPQTTPARVRSEFGHPTDTASGGPLSGAASDFDIVDFPREARPILLVVIDCEEEFDWGNPVRGAAHTLKSIEHLKPVQQLFKSRGVRPTYVIDYPIVADERAWRPLARSWADGECQIGAHLHPWVTPPFVETSTVAHSFQGNLHADVEFAKMEVLTDQIERRFGFRARIFKAGRYGFGLATAAALDRLGFEIDVSFLPHWRYDEQGGPSFVSVPIDPFWLRPEGGLLEIPLTAGFTGLASDFGSWLYGKVDRPIMRAARVPGALARGGILNRLRLSPEGVSLGEAKQLTRRLFSRGHRVFQVSFHSTSFVPGANPYVRSKQDLRAFLGWLAGYMEFFTDVLGGVPGEPHDVLRFAREKLPPNQTTPYLSDRRLTPDADHPRHDDHSRPPHAKSAA
jgi:lipopolysaccharide biosynthesis glycosyltransferase